MLTTLVVKVYQFLVIAERKKKNVMHLLSFTKKTCFTHFCGIGERSFLLKED